MSGNWHYAWEHPGYGAMVWMKNSETDTPYLGGWVDRWVTQGKPAFPKYWALADDMLKDGPPEFVVKP